MKKGLLTGLHCNFNREEAICIEKSSKVCSLIFGRNAFIECFGNDKWQTCIHIYKLTHLGI